MKLWFIFGAICMAAGWLLKKAFLPKCYRCSCTEQLGVCTKCEKTVCNTCAAKVLYTDKRGWSNSICKSCNQPDDIM